MAKDKQKGDAAAERKPKQKKPPTRLRSEINRVAKATGLPASFVAKQVAAKKKEIDEQRKQALDALADQVPAIVGEAIRRAGNGSAEPATATQ